MTATYTDLIDVMSDARASGLSIDRVVLTDESMSTFMTDGEFTDETEEKHEDLGEFALSIESGNGDYIVTESGEHVSL